VSYRWVAGVFDTVLKRGVFFGWFLVAIAWFLCAFSRLLAGLILALKNMPLLTILFLDGPIFALGDAHSESGRIKRLGAMAADHNTMSNKDAAKHHGVGEHDKKQQEKGILCYPNPSRAICL
jgi:hypothetical protein